MEALAGPDPGGGGGALPLGHGPAGLAGAANALGPAAAAPRLASGAAAAAGAAQQAQHPPLAYACVAGGLGGGVADLALHGLDTVKVRMQGQGSPPRYVGLRQTAWTIVREEGFFRGLYSAVVDFTAGAGVAFLSSVPSTMLYFASYEAIKRTLTPWTPDWAAHLAAGGMGDVIASAAVAPWEVVKTRLQLQGRYNNPLRRTEYNYRSWPNAMWSLYRYEGVASLFHGLGATCLRDAPFSALQFAIYEQLKKLLRRTDRPEATLSSVESLAAGGVAGTIAGAATTPLDVIKTRLQTNTAVSGTPMTRRLVRVAGSVYREEGVRGLFRGLVPRIIWTLPQSSIMFVVYEQLLAFMLLTFPPSDGQRRTTTSVDDLL